MALDQDSFEKFLSWLAPDREEAGMKYLELRRRLIRFFTWRGCHIPEELFDTTIERAAKKLACGGVQDSVDPFRYCYGVARNLLKEYPRQPKPDPLPENHPAALPVPTWDERTLACLDECLDRLSEHHRYLVRRWFQYEGGEKIRVRKEMAAEEGGPNALRIRIFRIKKVLRDCVSDCLSQENGTLEQ